MLRASVANSNHGTLSKLLGQVFIGGSVSSTSAVSASDVDVASCGSTTPVESYDPRKRTLFHELRRPPPVPLTINRRHDWPLVDLESSSQAWRRPDGMDSLSLTRHAEAQIKRAPRLSKRSLRISASTSDAAGSDTTARGKSDNGDLADVGGGSMVATAQLVPQEDTDEPWSAIAARFAELCPTMDSDLVSRLLKCLSRVRYADGPMLQTIVRGLSIEEQPPPVLAQWAGSLASLRGALGNEASQVFERIAQRTGEHSAKVGDLVHH